MSTSFNKTAITIEYKENTYQIAYVKVTDNDKSEFNVTAKDEALVNLTGNEFTYCLSFKDNLPEVDYPPTQGEEDLIIKKLILTKIFEQEGIEYIV